MKLQTHRSKDGELDKRRAHEGRGAEAWVEGDKGRVKKEEESRGRMG